MRKLVFVVRSQISRCKSIRIGSYTTRPALPLIVSQIIYVHCSKSSSTSLAYRLAAIAPVHMHALVGTRGEWGKCIITFTTEDTRALSASPPVTDIVSISETRRQHIKRQHNLTITFPLYVSEPIKYKFKPFSLFLYLLVSVCVSLLFLLIFCCLLSFLCYLLCFVLLYSYLISGFFETTLPVFQDFHSCKTLVREWYSTQIWCGLANETRTPLCLSTTPGSRRTTDLCWVVASR